MNQEKQRIQHYKEIFRTRAAYEETEKRMLEAADRSYDESEQLYLYAMVPVLMEYVEWVLKNAARSGKKRLFFLARDGYQMYLAAKKMAERKKLDIECRYLSASRFAMRVPEYHLLDEACLEKICVGGIDVTFEKICKRAALSEDESMRVALECGWEKDFRRVLNYQEVMRLKDILRKSDTLLSYIYNHSKKAYPNAIGYLEQEGLLEDVPFALVDSGWVGTLQQTIQNLLHSKNPKISVEGYYFGMYEYPKNVLQSNYHAYYFSPTKGLKRKVYFSNCLFEAIFSAPEGMTISYEYIEGKFKPVTDLQENPNVAQIRKNIYILERFLEYYNETVSEAGSVPIEKISMTFMGNPTETELNAYGETLFSDDVLEGHMQKVSAELSQEEIEEQRLLSKLLVMTGIKKEAIHESAWIEGSIVRNKKDIAKNLRHAHIYKYFIYIRKRLQQR